MHDEAGAARPVDRGPAQRRFAGTGLVSGVRVGSFSKTGELPTGRIVLYEVTPMSALRVADGDDWANAELLHRRAAGVRAQALLRGVALLVFDFDGVMTDNRVLVFDDGREAVFCSRGDGMGLEMLRKAGVPLAVISKEINPVVAARCDKLGIPYLQGIENKLAELTRIVGERGLDLARVAYVGNDVNDLECMHEPGWRSLPPTHTPMPCALPMSSPPRRAASAPSAKSATCCSPPRPGRRDGRRGEGTRWRESRPRPAVRGFVIRARSAYGAPFAGWPEAHRDGPMSDLSQDSLLREIDEDIRRERFAGCGNGSASTYRRRRGGAAGGGGLSVLALSGRGQRGSRPLRATPRRRRWWQPTGRRRSRDSGDRQRWTGRLRGAGRVAAGGAAGREWRYAGGT